MVVIDLAMNHYPQARRRSSRSRKSPEMLDPMYGPPTSACKNAKVALPVLTRDAFCRVRYLDSLAEAIRLSMVDSQSKYV